MKYIFVSLILIFCSCSNEKIVQLPEISNSNITEVIDVSAAYLFYNETVADSVELNRKNLIGTTNWLVNVDKRLTLNQAIPKIKFLQDKKRNAEMHKNEAAKNYYTCHDTSISNLGFIEFTDVIYRDWIPGESIPKLDSSNHPATIGYQFDGSIRILNPDTEAMHFETTLEELTEHLKTMDSLNDVIHLNFDRSISFQQYISLKSKLAKFKFKHAKIANEEFIFN
ncbi:hypothetical protein A9Q87_06740 [Flavobacteriales bacterium 34_180_T64]|nr:hypothetical protein A9Q87_06740 [Flavobacteriales bacterium 34_180_T64]